MSPQNLSLKTLHRYDGDVSFLFDPSQSSASDTPVYETAKWYLNNEIPILRHRSVNVGVFAKRRVLYSQHTKLIYKLYLFLLILRAD